MVTSFRLPPTRQPSRGRPETASPGGVPAEVTGPGHDRDQVSKTSDFIDTVCAVKHADVRHENWAIARSAVVVGNVPPVLAVCRRSVGS